MTDFYGYTDTPGIEQFSTYTRNVDPVSGRPREIFSTLSTTRPRRDPYTGELVTNIEQIGTQGICMTGRESACLNPKFDLDGDGLFDGIDPADGTGLLAVNAYEDVDGDEILDINEDLNMNGTLDPGEDFDGDGLLGLVAEDLDGDGILDLGSELEGLTHASVAQQIFAYVCAVGGGTFATDRSSCALTILGSQRLLDPTSNIPVQLGQGASSLLAGSPGVAEIVSTARGLPGVGPVGCVSLGSCPTSLTDPTLPPPGEDGVGGNAGFVFPFVRLNVDPGDLEARIEAFVEHYNHRRYHESLNNLTPADVYFGRGQTILLERERIKRKTIEHRRLQHRDAAA